MLAYKFLDATGSTVLTGTRWPMPDGDAPGPWLEAAAVRPCRVGIHACTVADLAYWIHQELWLIELEGDIVPGHHKVAAGRGRLVRRLADWSGGASRQLGVWCATRARDAAVMRLADVHPAEAAELGAASTPAAIEETSRRIATALGDSTPAGTSVGLAGDAARFAATDMCTEAPFITACAAGHAATFEGGNGDDFNQAYAAERRAQSAWIAERLQLA